MSSNNSTRFSAPPSVVRNKQCVFDNKLEIWPGGWDYSVNPRELLPPPPSKFPSLKTFANLASLAYRSHKDNCGLMQPTFTDELLDGFSFLSATWNSEPLNGYYAVCYVNKETRQLIISHRGTKFSTAGAIFTDLIGVVRKKFVPQVSSAITFTHKIVQYAAKHSYQVFFTGHSLGGWIAQITTFSTMFLRLDEVTGHFIGNQTPPADTCFPYTVVFDSPGAYEFLFSLKKSLFPRHLESTQEINIETLPVEVFLFHPNCVNNVNFHIGNVSTLDVEKVGVDTSKYFGAGTHGMSPVVKLLREMGEEDAVKWKVIDYRVKKKDIIRNSWDNKERTVPWSRSCVPGYFFSSDERRFLQGAKQDFPPEGQFEGINWTDEEIANDLVKITNDGEFSWRLSRDNYLVTCGELDKREFIPRVRRIVNCLRQFGTLWWKPKKTTLPANFIQRRMYPTDGILTEETLQKDPTRYTMPCSASEILAQPKTLVLFVDPPGQGKTCAVTNLEMELRSTLSSSARVIVRLNLNQVQKILLNLECLLNTKSGVRLIKRFVEYIPVSRLRKTFCPGSLPLYILLDGLDEVCPTYEQIMRHLLTNLVSQTIQGPFSVEKVILTTRPHLQRLVEVQFRVNANSLDPLNFQEQVKFLQGEIGPALNAKQSLNSLPTTARSLMENPLMLSLYAQVLRFRGVEGVVNIFDLFSQFMEAKHELHVVEKEAAEPAKQTTRLRVASILSDNLSFYYAIAVAELVTRNNNSALCEECEPLLIEPSGKKLEELISYGVLVSHEEGRVRFKHKSFAEFFYASLLMDDSFFPRECRNALFWEMYEYKGPINVEEFVVAALLTRQEEASAKSPSYLCKLSFGNEYLCTHEAETFLGRENLDKLSQKWLMLTKGDHSAVSELCNHITFNLRKKIYEYVPKINFQAKGFHTETRGEFGKISVLNNFYNSRLFPLLCGGTILRSLDYTDPQIQDVIKEDTRTTGNFLWWLCGFADRKWARVNLFQLKEESATEVKWSVVTKKILCQLITMMVVRNADISRLLSHYEISTALKFNNSMVHDAWSILGVEKDRVKNTLTKFASLQDIKQSMVCLLKDVSGLETFLCDFEVTWWFAEVFTSQELLSAITDNATRVTDAVGLYPSMIQRAFGDEFLPRCQYLKFRGTSSSITGQTIFSINQDDFGLMNMVHERMLMVESESEIETSFQEEFVDALMATFAQFPKGWEILQRLERFEMQRDVGMNQSRFPTVKRCPITNVLERLFSPDDSSATIFEIIGVKPPSILDFLRRKTKQLQPELLWEWFPFIIRYSKRIDFIKAITKYLSSFKISDDNFAIVARCYLLAHKNDCPSISHHVRSFIRGLKINPDFLLHLVLEADETELQELILENLTGNPVTVTNTPVLEVLTGLMLKNNIKCGVDEIGYNGMFEQLVTTSSCRSILRVLKQFHNLFTPDLEIASSLTQYSCSLITWITVPNCVCCAIDLFRSYFSMYGEDVGWMTNVMVRKKPVEILRALEHDGEPLLNGIPPLHLETRLSLVNQVEKRLRENIVRSKEETTIIGLTMRFSYETEAEWERLLQALQLTTLHTRGLSASPNLMCDPNRCLRKNLNGILSLIRVWVQKFGVEKTRAAADGQELWGWLAESKDVLSSGEFLHAAVEVGSLKGAKELAWPGLLKWKNTRGKNAVEVAREIWGPYNEVSVFLEEKLKSARIFQRDM